MVVQVQSGSDVPQRGRYGDHLGSRETFRHARSSASPRSFYGEVVWHCGASVNYRDRLRTLQDDDHHSLLACADAAGAVVAPRDLEDWADQASVRREAPP